MNEYERDGHSNSVGSMGSSMGLPAPIPEANVYDQVVTIRNRVEDLTCRLGAVTEGIMGDSNPLKGKALGESCCDEPGIEPSVKMVLIEIKMSLDGIQKFVEKLEKEMR